jgi:hypothetical protein
VPAELQLQRLAELLRSVAAVAADGAVILPDSNGSIEFALGVPIAAFSGAETGEQAVRSLVSAVRSGQSWTWSQGGQGRSRGQNLAWTPARLLDTVTEGATQEPANEVSRPRRGLLPPLPPGEAVDTGGRGFFGLINSLSDALVTVGLPPHGAVVVLDGRPVDAVTHTAGGDVQLGADAMDALIAGGLGALSARRYPAALLRALPVYWRAADVLPAVAARLVDPELFVRALLRPGYEGAVLVFGGGVGGVILFRGGEVLCAYRTDGQAVAGMELISPLLNVPDALMRAVLGRSQVTPAPESAPARTPIHPVSPDVPAVPPQAAGLPDPLPVASMEPDQQRLREVRDQIRSLVQRRLQSHAGSVLPVIDGAPLTQTGLSEAIEELAGRRIRFVRRSSMEDLATQSAQLLGALEQPGGSAR